MNDGQVAGALGAMMGTMMFFWCGAALLIILGMWMTFTKAGKPGWAAIIPIYNGIVLLEIAGKPIWWILLMLIPIVNVVIAFMALAGVAKAFGHGIGFAVGLFFLPIVFFPILGFGGAQYQAMPATA